MQRQPIGNCIKNEKLLGNRSRFTARQFFLSGPIQPRFAASFGEKQGFLSAAGFIHPNTESNERSHLRASQLLVLHHFGKPMQDF